MTPQQRILIAAACWLIVGTLGWLLFRRFWQVQAAEGRLLLPEDGARQVVPLENRNSYFGRYMRLAGFPQPWAAAALALSIMACLALGIAAALFFRVSGLQQLMLTGVEIVPGGFSGVLIPIVLVAPWLVAVIIASLPWLLVRASRRNRIQQVNRDMPLALDLWATLAEGGLGFDAAMDRWLQTQPQDRALATTARGYRRDLLTGMKRVTALRRWSERLDVPAVTRFTGAMIQSEQSGASISETLRLQAEDGRADRREKSMTFAQSLATKRIIPLVICFLPGLFVWPLGPFFVELFRIVDSLTR